MKFKINDVSACGGGDHVTVQVQRLPAGRTWPIHFSKKEALSVKPEREREREKLAIERIVSAVRESGETTPAGIRTFLLNKEFEV